VLKYRPWETALQVLRAAIANLLSKVELDRHSGDNELLGQSLVTPGGLLPSVCQGAASNRVGRVCDVRLWHKADMLNALTNVRFWGQSGQ
jgi:hypothetical protein